MITTSRLDLTGALAVQLSWIETPILHELNATTDNYLNYYLLAMADVDNWVGDLPHF